MNNLNIGKAVTALLSASPELSAKVGNKIFPIVAQFDTKFPFICYRRRGVTPNYVKDTIASEVASVELLIAATSYSESVDIAGDVRAAMELKAGVYGGIVIRQIYLAAVNETFDDGIYIQSLTFNIRL